MDAATTSWPTSRRLGGIAASLGCSALLHGVLALLPLGLAGPDSSAFAASPAVAAKSHLPLVVAALNRVAGPLAAPAEPTPPPPTEQRRRVVELSATEPEPRPPGPSGLPRFDDYLPASALTTPPGLYTLGPTEPASYEAMAGGGRLVIELFLGAGGAVEHWQVVEETAPPAFRQHVLNTFLAATYTPGRLFERAVKSRLKVEASLAPGGKYPP